MRKRWLGVMLVIVLLLLVNPVLAKWYTDVGVGKYSFSLREPNGFIKSFNTWLKDTCGVNFEAEEMAESTTLYSLGSGVEFPNGWKIGLDLGYRAARESYTDKLMSVPLEGKAEKLVRVKTYSFNGGVFGDLMFSYRFVSSKSGLVPYIGTGLGWYATVLYGEYLVEEYTPALGRSFSGSFSATGLSLAHVIVVGVESSGEKSRIRLEAKYHQVGRVGGEFGYLENDGFATLPFKPDPFSVNVSGWTISGGLMFNL